MLMLQPGLGLILAKHQTDADNFSSHLECAVSAPLVCFL